MSRRFMNRIVGVRGDGQPRILAWGTFTMSGVVPVLQDQFNVSSVARTASGVYKTVFARSVGAHYALSWMAQGPVGVQITTLGATNVIVSPVDASGIPADIASGSEGHIIIIGRMRG